MAEKCGDVLFESRVIAVKSEVKYCFSRCFSARESRAWPNTLTTLPGEFREVGKLFTLVSLDVILLVRIFNRPVS